MSDTETDHVIDDTAVQPLDPIDIAAGIVSAYVSKNSLPAAELPALIRNTYAAVLGLSNGGGAVPAEEESVPQPTLAQIRKSITPDALISFVDGKPYKTLKRHLTTNGLNPRSYCERYGLPSDYPMVAPNYARMRSELAKSIGLGNNRPKLPDLLKPPAEEPKPRGRRTAG